MVPIFILCTFSRPVVGLALKLCTVESVVNNLLPSEKTKPTFKLLAFTEPAVNAPEAVKEAAATAPEASMRPLVLKEAAVTAPEAVKEAAFTAPEAFKEPAFTPPETVKEPAATAPVNGLALKLYTDDVVVNILLPSEKTIPTFKLLAFMEPAVNAPEASMRPFVLKEAAVTPLEAVKEPVFTAPEAVKEAAFTAPEAVKEAAFTAPEAVKEAAFTAPEAVKEAAVNAPEASIRPLVLKEPAVTFEEAFTVVVDKVFTDILLADIVPEVAKFPLASITDPPILKEEPPKV
jgi:hypothetical protein